MFASWDLITVFFSPWLPLLSSPLHYVTLCMTPAHVARPLLSTAPLSIGRRNQWGPPHTALDSALLNTCHVSFSYRNSDWFRCHTQTTSMNSNMPVPRSLFARKRRKHWSFWRIKYKLRFNLKYECKWNNKDDFLLFFLFPFPRMCPQADLRGTINSHE